MSCEDYRTENQIPECVGSRDKNSDVCVDVHTETSCDNGVITESDREIRYKCNDDEDANSDNSNNDNYDYDNKDNIKIGIDATYNKNYHIDDNNDIEANINKCSPADTNIKSQGTFFCCAYIPKNETENYEIFSLKDAKSFYTLLAEKLKISIDSILSYRTLSSSSIIFSSLSNENRKKMKKNNPKSNQNINENNLDSSINDRASNWINDYQNIVRDYIAYEDSSFNAKYVKRNVIGNYEIKYGDEGFDDDNNKNYNDNDNDDNYDNDKNKNNDNDNDDDDKYDNDKNNDESKYDNDKNNNNRNDDHSVNGIKIFNSRENHKNDERNDINTKSLRTHCTYGNILLLLRYSDDIPILMKYLEKNKLQKELLMKMKINNEMKFEESKVRNYFFFRKNVLCLAEAFLIPFENLHRCVRKMNYRKKLQSIHQGKKKNNFVKLNSDNS